MRNITTNMTEGSPMKHIAAFAMPMLLGNIFQQVYNLVDTIIVGRFVSDDALAAVGTTGIVIFFLISLINGLCNGAGIILAQCFGNKKTDQFRKTAIALVYIVAVLTVLVIFIGNLGARTFLSLLKVPDGIINDSCAYMRICITFIFGLTAHSAAGALLRSVGDSKTPLFALIFATITNIALDLLFVLTFGLGVAGVAYATVISQMLSASICIIHIVRFRKNLFLEKPDWKPDKKAILSIAKTGIPTALQSSLISLGGMSVQGLVNTFETSAMAAYTTVQKIDSIAIQLVVSFGTSLSVFTGQNIGNFERIKKALRHTMSIMVGSCLLLAVTVLLFKENLLGIFLDKQEAAEAIAIGCDYMTIIGIAYVIAGVMNSYLNVIRGAGDISISILAGFAELSARVLFAYLLVKPLGLTGIWLATPISWGCGCIIPVVRYYSGKWKFKRLV